MTTETTGGENRWRYTWEEWDDSCLQEPLRDGERALLGILQALGEPFNPVSPPPLWDNEGFTYNPKKPEDIADIHYCLVNDNQFIFCGKQLDCLCDKDQLYYSLRKTVNITPNMIKGNMGLAPKDNEKELKIQRRVVSHLSKQLRNNCDKIFERTIPFVIEAPMLKTLCDAINLVSTTRESADEFKEYDAEFQDLVMFLSDFCQQTPSLCITYSNSSKALKETSSTSSSDVKSIRASTSGASSSVPTSSSSTSRPKKDTAGGAIGGVAGFGSGSGSRKIEPTTVDISLFKSIQILELRNVPPHKLTGMGTIRVNLQRMKCSRNLKSISQLLSIVGTSNVAQIWPELKELDLSYNRIQNVLEDEIAVLELCPSLEILNLSRNRISAVGDKFFQCFNSLSTLNLSFNQLTRIPPIPPSVKVLLLSHNLITNITHLNSKTTLLDAFNTYCPLKNLEVLDLSINLISDESDLLPLKEMNSLQKLSLTGNPLSFSEGYRRTVSGYLSRFVISRKFELDKKNFSSSEVKVAIEDCKEGKFIPYIPASSLLISQANSAMSGSLTSGGSMSTSNSLQRSATSVSQFKSMSQSYDSSSSSMRSLRRKKPKIREITTYDFAEDVENSYSEGTSSIRSGSSLDSKKEDEIHQQTSATRTALTTLREKYGPEHWLLRQAGTEVDRLLKIPDRPINYEIFSRSLPQNPGHSSLSPPSSSCYYERAMANERYTNEEVLLITSRKARAASEEEKTPLASPPSSSTNTPNQGDGSSSAEFFSCFDSGNPQEDFSIFDLSKDEPIDEVFNGNGKEFQTFKIFQNGEVFKLVVYDGYLMEVNAESMVIINQWDLNCLFALEEEKCDSETESVQFRLKFDTMRKTMRERSFIMGKKEFLSFDKLASPYIEERTLEEFTEALQCTKCFAQFSKGMAGKTVKHEKGQAPRQVRICPDPQCGNDILVTLDNIPLPNNECLDFEGGPLKASTPVFAKPVQISSLSQSIPKGRSPRVFDFMRFFPSSLSRKSLNNEESTNKENSLEDCRMPLVHAAKSVTPTSSDGGATNTKSESDIEVLSTDSSSIEVLGRHCPDSESEVDVEEALEIPVIDTSYALKDKAVVMSESTSSSSCADSIVTTYEKNLLPISQPLSSPSRMPSGALCTNASFTSTYTITTNSLSSPIHNTATCMPVRYDYVNFAKTDHRLLLWSDISVFKSDEELVAITKCMIISDSASIGNFLGIVIFSTKKVYLYRITGNEGDRPQEWLQKVNSFDLAKFTKLDVLIGRHGVGVDFSGKYFALIFRDSERTSGFLEFFMSDICGKLKTPPMVRDFSQTQKMMLSPVNPISYFGVMRFAVCDSLDNAYSVSAVLLTNEEILLITDLGWMAGRCDKVSTTHGRQMAQLRQVERMETDGTFIRLIFELEVDTLVNWELIFETEGERCRFEDCMKADLGSKDVPFICLSQPLES